MQPLKIESVKGLLVSISRQLKEHGWSLVVLPVEDTFYHFTLGLPGKYQHPDLEVLGLDEQMGRDFLNELVTRIKQGARFQSGDFFTDLVEGYDLFLVNNPVSPNGPPLTGERLRLVWPDARNRYPWHSDCEADCSRQRLIPDTSGIELSDLKLLLKHAQPYN